MINTPLYISCARCRCYSETERCMQMQWTIGLGHGHGVGDWRSRESLSQRQSNPGHSEPPGTLQMLCVHLLSSLYFLCLRKKQLYV